jgi:disulfide oxidoreductase YuzD
MEKITEDKVIYPIIMIKQKLILYWIQKQIKRILLMLIQKQKQINYWMIN